LDLLLIESTSFKRFLQAQVSAQDNTTNQFNDAEKYFNPFITEDIMGTESKENNNKNKQLHKGTYRKPFRSQR